MTIFERRNGGFQGRAEQLRLHNRFSYKTQQTTMSRNQCFRPVRIRSQPHTRCADCLVRPSSLFACAPESTLDHMQEYRETQLEVAAGQTLIYEGERPQFAYTLYSGWVTLFQTLHSGKRQILRFGLPGDFIGLQVNGSGVVAYAVEALTDAVFCAFRYPVVGRMLDNEAFIGKRLLAMQIRDSNLCQHHLMGAGRKSAEEKIAFLLLELYHRARLQLPASAVNDDGSIVFPLTQEDIADAVGLSKIHVNRVLRDLVKRGYILCEHKRLRIVSEDRLARLAEFEVSMITTPELR